MKRKIRKLASLSPGDLSIVLRATLLLPVVATMLRVKGFNWTRSHVQGKTSTINPASSPDERRVAEIPLLRNVTATDGCAEKHEQSKPRDRTAGLHREARTVGHSNGLKPAAAEKVTEHGDE